MAMKVVRYVTWKAKSSHQSPDIQSAILVRLQTNDRCRFGLNYGRGMTEE